MIYEYEPFLTYRDMNEHVHRYEQTHTDAHAYVI